MRSIRNLEIYIHEGTIKDLIAAHLYATTIVADNEEVLEVSLGEVNMDGVRAVMFKTITNKEVELIVHS